MDDGIACPVSVGLDFEARIVAPMQGRPLPPCRADRSDISVTEVQQRMLLVIASPADS